MRRLLAAFGTLLLTGGLLVGCSGGGSTPLRGDLPNPTTRGVVTSITPLQVRGDYKGAFEIRVRLEGLHPKNHYGPWRLLIDGREATLKQVTESSTTAEITYNFSIPPSSRWEQDLPINVLNADRQELEQGAGKPFLFVVSSPTKQE